MSTVDDLYMARVYLAQARACRGNPAKRSFHATLLGWAGRRRRLAACRVLPAKQKPGQLDLFGSQA